MIRVLIVTPVCIYCDLLSLAFRHTDRFVVIGCARTPFQGAELLQRDDADVALIDATSFDLADALHALRVVAPMLGVVALAVPETEADVVACAEAGASAIVTRDMPLTTLLRTVEGAEAGELHCSPRVAASLLRRVQALKQSGASFSTDGLTVREREVLRLIDQGYSNREIAQALSIELGTVKNHVHNILRKLHVSRRSDAARRARHAAVRRTAEL